MRTCLRRLLPAGLAIGLASTGLGGCALGPLATQHDASGQADIDRAQHALDTMGGLKARFVQTGPGADSAAGVAWFETGHLRLQYQLPSARLVVAARGRLVMLDAATDSTTRISLSANPLGLLLSGPVRLSGAIDVTDIQRGATSLQLSLTRASNPAQGLLTLLFTVRTDGTMLLSGLEAVDAERHRTRFQLDDQQTGQRFDPALFSPPG